jgi:5-methyltetrahydropteroyltriglutamate--homocysteine methyltransferase
MTKWFDTNDHVIAPEFTAATRFTLDAVRLTEQLREARAQSVQTKPVIMGPLTCLAIGKAKDGSDKLALLPPLPTVYAQPLDNLAAQGVEWVQMDEPILLTELDADWQHGVNIADTSAKVAARNCCWPPTLAPCKKTNTLAANLPVAGRHLDALSGRDDVLPLLGLLSHHKVLSLGVVHGRNIWKTDLNATPDWLEPLAQRLGDHLWIAPSCSLLHVPVDLDSEKKRDAKLHSWLAFALQKMEKLHSRRRTGRLAAAARLSHHDHWLLPANGSDSPSTQ